MCVLVCTWMPSLFKLRDVVLWFVYCCCFPRTVELLPGGRAGCPAEIADGIGAPPRPQPQKI